MVSTDKQYWAHTQKSDRMIVRRSVMAAMMKTRAAKSGLPPGSLVHIGEKKSEAIQISLISYNEAGFEEKTIGADELGLIRTEKSTVNWISVEGIHDVAVIEKVGKHFGIHPLVLEDILNTEQRPKIENYDKYAYIVAKSLLYDKTEGEFTTEQESFILGENYVISFSESKTGTYDPLREHIRQGLGHVRKMGADYLVYSLLDVLVDNYFDVLESLSDKIEFAEDALISTFTPDTLQVIHKLKKQMLYLHKAVWPMREVIGALDRSGICFVNDSTLIYVRDLYDHVVQIIDTTETLRDILSSMLDMYLSSVSNRMNEIMKVLTMMSTVFIPLTFIAGVYGMNLIMPEYHWTFMYPVLWAIMISIVIVMLAFFKKKKWW